MNASRHDDQPDLHQVPPPVAGPDGTRDEDDDAPVLVWPASALDAAERGFQALVRQRTPVAFDARGLGHGLPDRHIPLEELRDLLAHDPRVSWAAKDAAWHQVIDHARTLGQPWTAAAVGLALPALVAMARRLRPGREQVISDVESELVTGFLAALHTADMDGPKPQVRMCWAGWRAAILVRNPNDYAEVPDTYDPSTTATTPAHPYGHPDLVLGRAARLGYIWPEEAELISQTRFGRVLIDTLAAQTGIDAGALFMQRRRAELAVAKAIATGDLSGTACDIAPARDRPAANGRTRRAHRKPGPTLLLLRQRHHAAPTNPG